MGRAPRAGRPGFTLIELLVVLAIIGTLLSIAAPRYFRSAEVAREAALRQDLAVMRDAIDKHYGDTGRYPASLQELVGRRYLRRVPADPFTDRDDTWLVATPPERESGAVYNVSSGASGVGLDGTPYAGW